MEKILRLLTQDFKNMMCTIKESMKLSMLSIK